MSDGYDNLLAQMVETQQQQIAWMKQHAKLLAVQNTLLTKQYEAAAEMAGLQSLAAVEQGHITPEQAAEVKTQATAPMSFTFPD